MRKPIFALVSMEVEGPFGEREKSHLSKELDSAVTRMWDQGVVTPDDTDDTLIGYRGVDIYDQPPRAVIEWGDVGFEPIAADFPIQIMSIDATNPGLATYVRDSDVGELQLVPADIYQMDEPAGFGTFEIKEVPEQTEVVENYFDYATDTEATSRFASLVKSFIEKDNP